jgi:hypothetical protein
MIGAAEMHWILKVVSKRAARVAPAAMEAHVMASRDATQMALCNTLQNALHNGLRRAGGS